MTVASLIINSSRDLNNPANFGWPGGRVNMQDEKRETETKGVRANLTFGGDKHQRRVSVPRMTRYRETSRPTTTSQAWQNAVCGNNPNVFVPGPNTQPPCRRFDVRRAPRLPAIRRIPVSAPVTPPGFRRSPTAGR